MIVLPMAGRSSRFFSAGFVRPKYELPLGTSCVLEQVVRSFERQFEAEYFVFGVRSDYDAAAFVSHVARQVGIADFDVIVFDHETEGQADTVAQMLRRCPTDGEDLTIFNCDSIHTAYDRPDLANDVDGYLEVFRGAGTHWSFVQPSLDGEEVLRTTEKDRISDLCSNGLYWFRTAHIFLEALAQAQSALRAEQYVAPLYNSVIASGGRVVYREVPSEAMIFCGTPDEYVVAQRRYVH